MKTEKRKENLFTDEIFQAVYGQNPIFLKWLLEDMNETLKGKINIPEKLHVEKEAPLLRTRKTQKKYRGDILIVSEKGYLSIEVFTKLEKKGIEKSIAYMNRIYGTQMEEKEKKYHELKKVTLIIIAETIKTKIGKEWIQKYDLRNEKQELLNEALEIYIIRLDKISVGGYNEGENNKLKKHILMMGATTKEEREKIAKGSERLMTISEYVTDFMDDEVTNDFFSLERKKEIMYGEEARREGRKEEQRKIAKNLLQENIPLEMISRTTKLSKEEIKKLIKE